MSDTNQQQDHPGPEWVEWVAGGGGSGEFWHPSINPTNNPDSNVHWGRDGAQNRAWAIERCRAISAAALHWERVKSRDAAYAAEAGRALFSSGAKEAQESRQ